MVPSLNYVAFLSRSSQINTAFKHRFEHGGSTQRQYSLKKPEEFFQGVSKFHTKSDLTSAVEMELSRARGKRFLKCISWKVLFLDFTPHLSTYIKLIFHVELPSWHPLFIFSICYCLATGSYCWLLNFSLLLGFVCTVKKLSHFSSIKEIISALSIMFVSILHIHLRVYCSAQSFILVLV